MSGVRTKAKHILSFLILHSIPLVTSFYLIIKSLKDPTLELTFFLSFVSSWTILFLLLSKREKSKLEILLYVSFIPIFFVLATSVLTTQLTFLELAVFGICSILLLTPVYITNNLSKQSIFLLILICSIAAPKTITLIKKLSFKSENTDTLLELVQTEIIDSHFSKLRIEKFRIPTQTKPGIYSFSEEFKNQIIWADAKGNFYSIHQNKSVKKLNINLITNRDQFIESVSPDLQLHRFSIKDIAESNNQLYISHHYWNDTEKCYTLRVSSLPISETILEQNIWDTPTTLFESSPCIPIHQASYTVPGQLMESGGKIDFIDDSILLTLGDNMFDGRGIPENLNVEGDRRPIYAQEKSNHYGKTVLIDINNRNSKIFTFGHRNPQGLYIDEDHIYLTEHGPKGGDELNILRDNLNYGWPIETYGTDYSSYDWPLSKDNGEHNTFEKPIYSWVPSIGISDLIKIKSTLFYDWQGDILVTSLKNRSIYRVRIRDNRVLYSEPILIGEPIRDIIELKNGEIVLSTTSKHLIWLSNPSESTTTRELPPIKERIASANVEVGETLFVQQCSTCHTIDSKNHSIGPSLMGMFSNKDRSNNGFSYSANFTNKNIVWSDSNLDEWIESPTTFVPGTDMKVPGIPDPQKRADLILYLKNNLQ